MGRNQASTRHVRHVEKGQMLVSTRGPRVEALSQVGHLSILLTHFFSGGLIEAESEDIYSTATDATDPADATATDAADSYATCLCRRCPAYFHADAAHAAHARQRRTRPALALEAESEDIYSPSVPHQNEPLPSLIISNNDYLSWPPQPERAPVRLA